jgi:hypothetical protein
MPSTIDKKIQGMIARKKARDADEAENKTRAKTRIADRNQPVSPFRAKWAGDTVVLADIVREIVAKAKELKLSLTFQHTPASGTLIGSAVFVATAPGTATAKMTWNVQADGTIRAFFDNRHRELARQVPDFQLLSAKKQEYEHYILEFVDKVVG